MSSCPFLCLPNCEQCDSVWLCLRGYTKSKKVLVQLNYINVDIVCTFISCVLLYFHLGLYYNAFFVNQQKYVGFSKMKVWVFFKTF